MSQIALAQVHALLAAKHYAVTETSDSGLRIQEVDSGLILHAELQGEILFFTIACASSLVAHSAANAAPSTIAATASEATNGLIIQSIMVASPAKRDRGDHDTAGKTVVEEG